MSYSDIIKRLEDATGPDVELEGRIWCAANGYCFVMWDGAGCVYKEEPNGDIQHMRAITERRYTASIDAAIALVERMMKTYSLSMGIDPSGNGASLVIWPNGFSGYTELGPYEGCATSLPVAILLALFRALEAKEQAA